jgi:hypothetical protein
MSEFFTEDLCSVERDRMTAAEICIDELLTIMDRHGVRGEMHLDLRNLSMQLSDILLVADGPVIRKERLIRIRAALTTAFPMTDEDLSHG